jgi:hypothetical protein
VKPAVFTMTYHDDGDTRILTQTVQHPKWQQFAIYYLRNIKSDIGTSSERLGVL